MMNLCEQFQFVQKGSSTTPSSEGAKRKSVAVSSPARSIGGRSGIIWILIFMIPVVFASMIYDSYKNFLPDPWFTKTLDYLLTYRVWMKTELWTPKKLYKKTLSCHWGNHYNQSLCLDMEFFLELNINHQSYWRNKLTVSSECSNYIRGVRRHAPPGKILKIVLSETPYPAFPGSNAINSYVHFFELFSESRYSWFQSRSTKIHDSQVFKTKIHDSYIFCNYDSWFMILLPPPTQ